MTEQVPSEKQCPHPADQIQSGICAPGINLPPVCLACGQHVESGEVIVTEEPACQSM